MCSPAAACRLSTATSLLPGPISTIVETYWRFHLRRERERVHESHCADGVIPRAA